MSTAIYNLGRILLSAIFLVAGYRMTTDFSGTVESLAAKNIPFTEVLAVGAVGLQIVGGLMVATGYRPRLGAVLLLIFLIPTTVLFHPPAFPAEMMPFLKNLAVMGGLLVVIGATGREAKG
jgi:putative oxidoreductase